MLNRFMRDVCKTYASENNVGLPLTAENMLNALTSWFERYYNTLIPRINVETNEWELFNINTQEFEPTGVMATGARGEDGHGLEITGAVYTVDDLPTENVALGTAYMVGSVPDNVLYTYSLLNGTPTWVNQGSLRAIGLGDGAQFILNAPPTEIYYYYNSENTTARTIEAHHTLSMVVSFRTISDVTDWTSIAFTAGGAKVCMPNIDLYGNTMGMPETNLYPSGNDFVNGGTWNIFISNMGYVNVLIGIEQGIRFYLDGVEKIRYLPTRLFNDNTTTVRDFVVALLRRFETNGGAVCYSNSASAFTHYSDIMVTPYVAGLIPELYTRYKMFYPTNMSVVDSEGHVFSGTAYIPTQIKFNEDFTETYENGVRTVGMNNTPRTLYRHLITITYSDVLGHIGTGSISDDEIYEINQRIIIYKSDNTPIESIPSVLSNVPKQRVYTYIDAGANVSETNNAYYDIFGNISWVGESEILGTGVPDDDPNSPYISHFGLLQPADKTVGTDYNIPTNHSGLYMYIGSYSRLKPFRIRIPYQYGNIPYTTVRDIVTAV